jgi:hypothetical protein
MMPIMIMCNAILKLSTFDLNAGDHVSMLVMHPCAQVMQNLIMGHNTAFGFVSWAIVQNLVQRYAQGAESLTTRNHMNLI